MLAWLIGPFLAPPAPDPFGSAVTINAYFSAQPAAMIQSVFIHGLAGAALLGLTAALWNYLAARNTAGPRRVMLAAGVLAAAVSFLQVALHDRDLCARRAAGQCRWHQGAVQCDQQGQHCQPILLAVFVRDLLAGHARGKLVITVTGAG